MVFTNVDATKAFFEKYQLAEKIPTVIAYVNFF